MRNYDIKSMVFDAFFRFKDNFGILGMAAVAAVALKFLLFYNLVGVSSYFVAVWLLSCFFVYLLFASFKNNKWIPAVLFLLASILMFSDVTYCSFFNRYLSVNMLGAAGVLGDITESIKEVMRPVNFLLLADAVLVLFAVGFSPFRKQQKLKKQAGKQQTELQQVELQQTMESEVVAEKKTVIANRAKRNRKKQHWKQVLLTRKHPILAMVVLLLFVVNVTGSSFVQGISNQEIFTYHVKDVIGGIQGQSESGNLAAFTDSYVTEKEGPLFGAAAGRNVIVIQMESLQNFVVGMEYNGQEITPNLNRLIEGNSAYFDNYYQQVGSGNTSDAEFASNNSLYGTLTSYTYKLFDQNYFRGLPVLLSEKGYDTAVLHAHEDRTFWNRENAYKALGFNRYYGGLKGRDGDFDMTEWMGWGLTDSEFFKQAIDYIKELPQPFYSFVITLSNHHPYIMLDHYNFIDLLPEDENTIVGNYLQSAAYTDFALGQFLEELKAEGLYDSSIIALYGDHAGLPHSDEIDASMERLLGKPYDYDELMNIPLIITLPNSQTNIQQTVSIPGGQIDFLPTMAYLMGFEQLDTIYLGHNLLTVQEGFVAEQTFMTRGSFFAGDIAYEMSRDGVFKNGRAWNTKTGESVSVEDCYDGYIRSTDIVNTSEYVLRSDAIRKMFLEGQDMEAISSTNVKRDYPEQIVVAGYPDAALMQTNSVEALEATYQAGYKTIRLDVSWDESVEPSLPVAINPLTGAVGATGEQMIQFLDNNPDAILVANMSKSGDYLINYVSQTRKDLADRIVLEHPNMSEYSGRFEGIINLSVADSETKELLNYIERNNVWAVSMTQEEADGALAPLLKADCAIYIRNENGEITKRS